MISFNTEQRFIVTGASSGIGRGVALLLNELGATVIGIGRDEKRLEAMKAQAKYSEKVFWEQKDLTADIENLPVYVKSLKDKYGKFSGMAYCAGIMPSMASSAVDVNLIQKTFSINYIAPYMMVKGLVDKRNNIGEGTSCVVISSASSVLSDKGHSVYAGSKAALNASMKAVAKEVVRNKIRINCISPTNIRTENIPQEYVDSQIAFYPLGFGKANDVANFVAFLLSDKAGWITGQNYIMDCASF